MSALPVSQDSLGIRSLLGAKLRAPMMILPVGHVTSFLFFCRDSRATCQLLVGLPGLWWGQSHRIITTVPQPVGSLQGTPIAQQQGTLALPMWKKHVSVTASNNVCGREQMRVQGLPQSPMGHLRIQNTRKLKLWKRTLPGQNSGATSRPVYHPWVPKSSLK